MTELRSPVTSSDKGDAETKRYILRAFQEAIGRNVEERRKHRELRQEFERGFVIFIGDGGK